MTHIPYGYRIENGKAVIDEDAAERIRIFTDAYLTGLSIQKSNQAADIPLCTASLNKLLRNKTYLGTDYYPALITMEKYQRIAAEHSRRTHPGTRKPAGILKAADRFRILAPDAEYRAENAKKNIETLYRLIIPAEDGNTEATSEETAIMKNWIHNILNHQ